MITKNGKMLAKAVMLSNGNNNYAAYIPFTKIDGSTWYSSGKLGNNYPSSESHSVGFGNNDAGIRIGSGDTPATENDYKLESYISSGLSASNPVITTSVDANNNPIKTLTFTLVNTTASDIVVKEIGYYQNIAAISTYGSASNTSTATVMLDRTVLDTPITIPADGYAAIAYSIKMEL